MGVKRPLGKSILFLEVRAPGVHHRCVVIARAQEGSRGRQVRPEPVRPCGVQPLILVADVELDAILVEMEVEGVARPVQNERELIAGARGDGQMHVGVVEGEAVGDALRVDVLQNREYRIERRPPRSHQIRSGRCTLVSNRSVEVRSRGGEAQGHPAPRAVPIARAALYVDHAPESAAILGGVRAFVEGHRPDGVGVEHREEPKEMGRLVHRRSVKPDERLAGTASAHVQPTGVIRPGGYAGQVAEGSEEVVVEGRGEALNVSGPKAMCAKTLSCMLAPYGHRAHFEISRNEFNVDLPIRSRLKCDGQRLRTVPDVGNRDRPLPRQHPWQLILTVLVGRGAPVCALNRDVGLREWFLRLRVGDLAVEGRRLPDGRVCAGEHEQGG